MAGDAGGHAAARLAVLVPVGPREDLGELADTLDSVRSYTPVGTLLLLINDGARPAVHGVVARSGLAAEVLDIPGAGLGVLGGLTWSVARGLRRALTHPDVDLVLRLDADALLIGPGLDAAARFAVAAAPDTGALGSFDRLSTGEARSFGPAGWVLGQDLHVDRLRRPTWVLFLRWVLARARSHGYVDGEHALAGVLVLTRDCLQRMAGARLLPPPGIRSSRLGDDQFLGLAVRAVGFRTVDFATGSQPLALRWHGLPATPPELVAQGKLAVHSVKSYDGVDGDEVRAWFRARRAAGESA